jgi:hypothetical protein
MIHQQPNEMAGQTVKIKAGVKHPQIENFGGSEFKIEDWWDRVADKSWMDCNGNPACMVYGIRSGFAGLPLDNEVLYGKVGSFGHLVHISEIEQ